MQKSPKGIHCPECKSRDITTVGRYRPISGLRIRYFRCNVCRCGPNKGATRFKTEERMAGKVNRSNFVAVPK